jgi:hypothetical protein
VQLAISPDTTDGAVGSGPPSPATRLRPYLAAGVAIVGASLIAVNPVGPPVAAIQERAVQLASLGADEIGDGLGTAAQGIPADIATLNPFSEWTNVLGTAFDNVGQIGDQILADPFPILSQSLTNQLGYADTISTSLQAVGQTLDQFVTGDGAYDLVPTLQGAFADLAAGDVTGAAADINSILTSVTIGPALDLEPALEIPGEITTNLNNAVQSLLDPLTVLILGLVSTPEGVIDTLGNSGQAFVDAAGAGEPLQALSALINTPAEAVGALLNGVPDQGYVGLIEPAAGFLQTLAVDLPQTIAQALGAPAADSASAAADLTTTLDPSVALGDPSALLDSTTTLGDLSNLFDPSAVTDIGTLLGADLAPNLGGIALDLLTSF